MARTKRFNTSMQVKLSLTERLIVDYYASFYRLDRAEALRKLVRAFFRADTDIDADYMRAFIKQEAQKAESPEMKAEVKAVGTELLAKNISTKS